LFFHIDCLDLIPKANSVAVTNITLTTAKLSWELIPPNEETYGNIDGYKIIVRYGSVVNTTTVRDMASLLLQNISSNTSYCFHVVAFNVFGDGLKSNEKCFTTLGKYENIVDKTTHLSKTIAFLLEYFGKSKTFGRAGALSMLGE
jgi:hypothetical protein